MYVKGRNFCLYVRQGEESLPVCASRLGNFVCLYVKVRNFWLYFASERKKPLPVCASRSIKFACMCVKERKLCLYVRNASKTPPSQSPPLILIFPRNQKCFPVMVVSTYCTAPLTYFIPHNFLLSSLVIPHIGISLQLISYPTTFSFLHL